MAWTTPATFVAGQLLLAEDINKISENLAYLKARPRNRSRVDGSFNTTSATPVAISGLAFSITTEGTGSRFLVGINGTFIFSASGMAIQLGVKINGSLIDPVTNHLASAASVRQHISRTWLTSDTYGAGTHNFTVEWNRALVSGTLTVTSGDYINLWAIEV